MSLSRIGRPLLLVSLLAPLAFAARPVAAAGKQPGKAAAAQRGKTATKTGKHAPAAKAAKPGGAKAHHAPVVVHRVPSEKSGLPNVQALGALVLDENGHEIYARNPDHERPIASISKLAATLVVMDHALELEGLTTILKSDIDVTRGGAKSRLLEGMTLSNRDLLHAALMGSDNRAIPALGRSVKLTPSQLATEMSAKAKALGLKHTRFHDCTGLSIENVSTPRETIVMLKAVMRNPVLGPITQRIEYEAHPIGRPPIAYVNTYRPAVRSNVQVLGGKTGYNDDARYCLVIAARIDGHTCYMAFLSNEGKLTRFGDVARVADWMASRRPRAPPDVKVPADKPSPPAVAQATPPTLSATTPRPRPVAITPPKPHAQHAAPPPVDEPEIEPPPTMPPLPTLAPTAPVTPPPPASPPPPSTEKRPPPVLAPSIDEDLPPPPAPSESSE